MITAAELAGFFAAHAIWCVVDGDTLTPMLAYTNEAGERKMNRFVHDDLRAAVEHGRERLAKNDMDANDAVLLYDGRIAVDDDKLDAILLELRAYFSPGSEVILAVPYTPSSGESPFRVHKPKVLAWQQCEDFDVNQTLTAFFNGVARHEKGSEIWDRCLDESK